MVGTTFGGKGATGPLAQKSKDNFDALVSKTTYSLTSISQATDNHGVLDALKYFIKQGGLLATDRTVLCNSPYGTVQQKEKLLILAQAALERIHDFLKLTNFSMNERQSITPAKLDIFQLSNSLKKALAPKQPIA